MTDEKALLAAIWEHPHEDTPRLVYADWLQETGEPGNVARAEFIRVQCELERFDRSDDSPRKAELAGRENRLLTEHGEAWKAVLPPGLRHKKGTTFRRGFPVPPRQKLSPGKFLKFPAADLATAPLWHFELEVSRAPLPDVLASPNLLRVGTLGLRFWLKTPEQVSQFAASPNVRNVAELDLSHSRFGPEKVAELAAGANGLPNLRGLNLYFNQLTAGAIEELARSPLGVGLETLSLGMNPLGPDALHALAAVPGFGRLRSLGVTSCGRSGGGSDFTGDAVKSLCNSPHLIALRELYLSHNSLGAVDMRTMCESRPAFRLAVLTLSDFDPGIGDDGAAALAAWPALERLQVLRVTGCRIGPKGGRALANSPHLNNVTELWLQGNPVLDDPNAMGILRRRFGDALRLK